MNTIKDIIRELKELNIRIFVDGDNLLIESEKGVIDDRLKSLIKNNKVDLIKYINQIRSDRFSSISKAPTRDNYLLSSSQRRLFVLSKFEQANEAYNIPAAYVLNGNFNPLALESAFTSLVERHEILRTVFKDDDNGDTRQFINSANVTRFKILHFDLRHEKEKENIAKAQIKNEFIKPFNLETGPLLRASLFQLSETQWIFSYTMHHIISDGWSMGILFNELMQLYYTRIDEESTSLQPLRIHYKDYAHWQQERLYGETLNRHKEYWLKQFEGDIPILELEGDKLRPALKSFNGGRIVKNINSKIFQDIKELLQQQNCTLFMGLLSAVNTLLYRYTGQEDIIIGSPIAGRNHPDLENQIGFYVNTLAFRSPVHGNESFYDLLNKTKKLTLEAYEHQAYPFDELVDTLHLERDLSRSPLFDVLIVLQNTVLNPANDWKNLKDISIRKYEGVDTTLSKFDLTFNFTELENEIQLNLNYNIDIFHSNTIKRLGDHFEQLLAVIIEHPDKPVQELDYLSKVEKFQLLNEFNNTSVNYPKNKTVIDLFEEQVRINPNKSSLIFNDINLNYHDLNEKSNQLTSYLISNLKAKKGDCIGVMLDRSEWSVICMIGIMKLGCIYVPIDKSLPASRINFMIRDCGIKSLIIEDTLDSEINESFHKFRLVEINNTLKTSTSENFGSLASGKDPSFIIYTSGSTGNPKGVIQTHLTLYNLIQWDMKGAQLNTGQKHLQFSSFSFDSSLHDVFYTLATGGEIHIIDESLRRNLLSLKDYILKNKISVLSMPYSPLKAMFSEISPEDFEGHDIKEIISTGEQLFINGGFRSFLQSNPHVKIYNFYGPSETHVVTGITYCHANDELPVKASIGKPIHNTFIYILDIAMQPVPLGIKGEIYIGGWNLANGYTGNLKLTKENFIDDPFKKGEIIYKSGDIGKWFPDGTIEYIRRKDNQIKIRGYRIELGEVESALRSYEKIEEAIVIAKEMPNGEYDLVAYIISKTELKNQEIHRHLSTFLPEYMLPKFFIRIDRLPLTPNGKINKKVLPDPTANDTINSKEYIAPRNETEIRIINIWKQTLGIDKIGVRDNFFELGGNSILAIKIINKLQKEFKEIFQFSSLFEFPTPELFSNYILTNAENITTSVVTEDKLNIFRSKIQVTPVKPENKKLRRAIFILSPHRSGSTLLRVILGGHKKLFAPPELELADFANMKERADFFTGKLEFLKEGLIRTIIELKKCSVSDAKIILAEKEIKAESTYQIYKWLQDEIGNLALVDKTPSYTYSYDTLCAIENIFEDAFYIHLIRNPLSSILSFEEAKLDQVYRYEKTFNKRETAELEWLNCQDNIIKFLKTIPSNRQYALKYESLVTDPEFQARGLCDKIGIDFEREMLSVYENQSKKMTDGLYRESRMIGDLKFFTHHNSIDSNSLNRWENSENVHLLSKMTLNIADKLGYDPNKLHQTKNDEVNEITRVANADYYPLSHGQERLWVVHQLAGAEAAYNMRAALRLHGKLNIIAMQKALNTIVNRHETLRTCFVIRNGEPVQTIAPSINFLLILNDLTDHPDKEQLALQLAEKDAITAFDLSTAPLLRMHVVRMQPEEHMLLFNMHHIISDGWSMDVIIHELLTLYNSYIKGNENPLHPLRIQYKDYVAWQQQQLASDNLKDHKEYWLKQFEGELPVLELATDKIRPAIKTYNGSFISMTVKNELSNKLKTLSQAQGGTLFIGLLAAVNAFLYKYTFQEDIIIGSPIAGRDHIDLEDQIGFYVNTLAFRTRFNREDSFIEILEKTKKVALGAYEHQVYPFDELVEALNLQRDISRNPIYDVQVILHNAESNNKNEIKFLDKLRISRYKEAEFLTGRFDLTFNFIESEFCLINNIGYNTDLYEKETIERMGNNFEQLLNKLVSNSTQPLNCIDYLSIKEKNQLITKFNETGTDFPKDKTLVDLFEEQVKKTPDKIALVFEEIELSYLELNNRSDKLAQYIRAHYKVKSDDLIGIMLERSEILIVAILGILKSGAAYVPIDPTYPKARKEFIINDTRLKLLITHTDYIFDLEYFDGNVFAINIQFENIDTSIQLPPVKLNPNNTAYVIYTSGSTGEPHGVIIDHSAIVNTIYSQQNIFDVKTGDRVLQFASASFDASISEIFVTLTSGGSLYIISEDKKKNPLLLEEFISINKIDVATLPPAYLKMIQIDKIQTLKKLITAGESANLDNAISFSKYGKYINAYGPTESSICASVFQIKKGEKIELSNIPIGTPIQNAQIFILDKDLNLTPIGITGEICIGGSGLARGYLNNSILTSEMFITNPFKPGERIYKSGDYGKWLPNGNIEFIGRKDNQVKIRGHRIELSEIEYQLQNHELIDDAVVLAKELSNSDKELVGYIVSKSEIFTSDIRSYLSNILPAYMIPAYFVRLETLPLNSNGKIDKKAMVEMKESHLEQGVEYLAPRNEIEQHLINIFEEVLKKNTIGVLDDFFTLGGDSIKSIQVVSRLKQRGYSLTIQDVLLNPIIQDLAGLVKKDMRSIDQGLIEGLIQMSPIQVAFFKNHLNDIHHYNQSVLLSSKEHLSEQGIRTVLDKIIIHHDALRMVYHETPEGWIQENKGKEQRYSLEVIEEADDKLFAQYCDRIQSTINLESGPLFKAALFKSTKRDRLLLLSHHLVIDGVSWRILYEDFSNLYTQLLSDSPLTLPLKTDSFKYWSNKQLEFSKSEELEKEDAYWSSLETSDFKSLSLDYPDGSNLIIDLSSMSFSLNEISTNRLLTQCHKAYQTDTNDILLTTLSLAIKEIFGLDRIFITLEGHGREHIGDYIDVTRTIGWFTIAYPVVFDMSFNTEIIRQLIEIKEHLHRIPNKGIGYGVLRYLAGKNYKLNPEISFNYLGDFGTEIKTEQGGSLFEFSGEYHGRDISENMKRTSILDVSGIVINDKMRLTIGYNTKQYSTSTIERLLSSYQHYLENLIEHLSNEKNVYVTPVDLTYKGLSIEQLEELNKKL